ncbi:HET-domain-containing protein [Dendrothele bispora CBS 962.96]|uniref:HET-domain-containing protein n=1 Tax=Dendrothele bispora (strain CBS 962.96) TaxID=1314807 RepID=A0A4S8KY45_DENBC|nr:HET-domain-containing protein [Dendrothele bispora CBS 962.96]
MRLLRIVSRHEIEDCTDPITSTSTAASTPGSPDTTPSPSIPPSTLPGVSSSRLSHLSEKLVGTFDDFLDLSTTWFLSATSDPPDLEIVEFLRDVPPYVILSHTWEDDEVSFQDMQNPELARRKKGYTKILAACRLAQNDGYEYIWIDSCCINKDSSAELSEAINSMYRYYEKSDVCYAYLSDARRDEDPRSHTSSFRWCKWFTRGWTLQELLAPSELVFFDKGWIEMGTKRDLHDVITAITGIPMRVLFGDMTSVSIAKRMSWAAFRKTTRPEDLAYSLMGIFGVNIPPLYGEGLSNAFMRLQREIIISSDDRSIFAWVASRHDSDLNSRGLFARSPFEFRHSGGVGMSDSSLIDSSFSMMNSGLEIQLPLAPLEINDNQDHRDYLAFLHCNDETRRQHIAVYLQHQGGERFVRCRADQLMLVHWSTPIPSPRRIAVKEGLLYSTRSLQLDIRWSLPEGSTWNCTQWHCLWMDKGLWKRATPEPREIVLNERDEMLLGFKSQESAFAIVIRVIDNVVLANLVMEPDFDSSHWSTQGPPPATNPRRGSWSEPLNGVPSPIPVSFFEGGLHGMGRVWKTFKDKETVSLTAQKAIQESKCSLKISINHQSIMSISRQLQPPTFGFMIQVKSELDFTVKDVIPRDFFRVDYGPQDIYVSIDLDQSPALRVVVLECLDLDNVPLRISVTFGIHDLRAWSELVYDSNEETVESVLEAGAKTCRWEGEGPYRLEHPGFVRLRDGWHSIQAIVRFGRKEDSSLLPGSHWANIEIVN